MRPEADLGRLVAPAEDRGEPAASSPEAQSAPADKDWAGACGRRGRAARRERSRARREGARTGAGMATADAEGLSASILATFAPDSEPAERPSRTLVGELATIATFRGRPKSGTRSKTDPRDVKGSFIVPPRCAWRAEPMGMLDSKGVG